MGGAAGFFRGCDFVEDAVVISGEELAAVLLPNAINPTSAFLQILPMKRVTMTDLNMEQAMSMLLTGGAVAPETIQFSQRGSAESEAILEQTR